MAAMISGPRSCCTVWPCCSTTRAPGAAAIRLCAPWRGMTWPPPLRPEMDRAAATPEAAFASEQTRLAEARQLPGTCHDEFLRLTRTLLHGPAFQWLLIDAPHEGLRRQVMASLDKVLRRAGLSSQRLPLSDKILDVPMLEARLVKNARQVPVVHVIGRPGWFDAARWDAFNIRRERLAAAAPARLVFWLDGEAIALASRSAPDLWSWRGGVYAFLPETAPAEHHAEHAIPLPRDLFPQPAEVDSRSMTERSRRVAEIRTWLARHPNSPDEIKAGIFAELGRLLYSLGELDAAMAHWRDEQLPLVQRLGDSRAVAVTMGDIADVLQDRGESEEALRIRREEELPVYERLGDVRSRAVTMGKIADVLQQRGESEEALRIYREEVLPMFERLGAVRSRAVAMGRIADVLQERGESEEALRIRREELLPEFERLGDVESRAMTMGKIADVLRDRGESEEALRIYRDEVLPMFEGLGVVRWRAVAMGRIADVLQQRGEIEEALRIYREEELPVFERLGDERSLAVVMSRINKILQADAQHSSPGH
ncbi:MAG: tetratricopeptide repeat protein [Cyanobacteria bacterium K_Offshore_surface_m2_239]|nr:tetratricopeptide repeat protein [Cyanobacteria bacterium K_Offshore_surface_m2_239]